MAGNSGMERWRNRVAVVTGASVGIGAKISKSLVQHGVTVIGCARNIEGVEKLALECQNLGLPGKLIGRQCDVSKETEIEELFKWIDTTHKGADICINNAGFTLSKSLLDISAQEMRSMLDVNVVGLVLMASHAIKSMQKRGVNDGHVININSMLGHRVYGPFTFYSGSKFAVTALTEGFRRELVAAKSRIRVTQVSPGLVETEFATRALGDAGGQGFYKMRETSILQPQDVADAVIFALSAPENAQVHDIQIRPTGEPLA